MREGRPLSGTGSTEPQGSDHNENEVRMPRVLPSITVNRGLIPDSWGILGKLRRKKAKDRRPASPS